MIQTGGALSPEKVIAKYGKALDAKLAGDWYINEHAPPKQPKINFFVKLDPTGNKHVYLEWIVKSYLEDSIPMHEFGEDLYKFIKALAKFDKIKGKLPLGGVADPWTNERNIFNYSGLIGTKKLPGLNKLDAYPDPPIKFDRLIFRNHNVSIYAPETIEESIYYGRGTRWCTAAERSDNPFHEYYDNGKLYIIVPVNPIYTREKYQIHINSYEGYHKITNDGDADISGYILYSRYPEILEILRGAKHNDIESFIIKILSGGKRAVTFGSGANKVTYMPPEVEISYSDIILDLYSRGIINDNSLYLLGKSDMTDVLLSSPAFWTEVFLANKPTTIKGRYNIIRTVIDENIVQATALIEGALSGMKHNEFERLVALFTPLELKKLSKFVDLGGSSAPTADFSRQQKI